MKDGAFLQKITITRQATTWDETTKRPKTGTSSTISTGVKALLSHQSAGESDAPMGVLPTNRTLLFVEPTADLRKNDVVKDESNDREYVVQTQPFLFKNPRTGEDSHLQAEVLPLEPEDTET